MSRVQTNTTPTLTETYAVMMYGTKRTEVAEDVALIESYYDRPWIMSESAYRRASAAAERVPRYCFERSYVEDVLGLKAPIVESGVWPRDFEKRIIQEQLLFEGFFSDILQKGKDVLMSTVDGVKQFGKEAWSVLKGFYLAVREGKTESLFRAIAKDVIKGIYMPLKKALTYLAEKLPDWNMPTFAKAAQKALDMLKGLKDKMMSAKGWQKIAMASGVAIGLTWLWEKVEDFVEELTGESEGLTLEEADGDSKIAKIKELVKGGGPAAFQAMLKGQFKEIVEKIAMAASIGPWWEAAKKVGKGAAIVTAAIGGATAKFVEDHEEGERIKKGTTTKEEQNESYDRGTMKITKRQLRIIIREAMIDEPIRQVPGDSFPANTLKSRRSHKSSGSSEFRDTIVMSPAGDSILVGGYETEPSMIDVTLKELTGHEVPAGMYTALEKEINKQMSSGYVEIPISWSSDAGWRF